MDVNRRRILRAVGTATGASFIGVASVSGSTESIPDDRKIVEVGRGQRRRIIDIVQKDDEYRAIDRRFADDGWEPKTVGITVDHVTPTEGMPYIAVTIPYIPVESTESTKGEQRMILWSRGAAGPVSEVTARGQRLVQRNSERWEEMSYTFENRKIRTNNESVGSEGNRFGTNSNNNLDPGGGGGRRCIFEDEYCVEWNYYCLGRVALVAGSCVWAGGVSLLRCLAASFGIEILDYAMSVGCPVCKKRDSQLVDVCGDQWEVVS